MSMRDAVLAGRRTEDVDYVRLLLARGAMMAQGRSPSVRELIPLWGYTATSSVRSAIRRMVTRGWIPDVGRRCRAIDFWALERAREDNT